MAVAPAILAAAAVATLATSVAGGIAADKASKKEANLLMDQSRLAQEEALADAKRQADEGRQFIKNQKLAFLKNGVTLAGSPLLVLEETTRIKQEEVNATVRRGNAQSRFYAAQADIARRGGRASLISGIGGGVASAGSMFASGANQGLFSAGK